MADISAAAEAGTVFFKEFPYCVAHLVDDAFLDHFTHAFLIRDPTKSIVSYFKLDSNVREMEIGVREQRDLFDRIADRYGEAPPVIDNSDLIERPDPIIEAWCWTVGLDHRPDALEWEAGSRDELNYNADSGDSHRELAATNGFRSQPDKHIPISRAPAYIQAYYERALPHYDYMRGFRLEASSGPWCLRSPRT